MRKIILFAVACVGLLALGPREASARHYDPEQGRFLEEDPIQPPNAPDPRRFNLYVYADNNPTLYIDPLGLRPLTEREKFYMRSYIPSIDLQNADLHEGTVPWYLPSGYVGITRGNDIYFRPGIYNPDSALGLSLLGHELVHVGQYREGANWASFLWSYRHGYENSKYEDPAYALQYQIFRDLTPLFVPTPVHQCDQ